METNVKKKMQRERKKTEGKEVWKIKIFRREYFLKTKYEI